MPKRKSLLLLCLLFLFVEIGSKYTYSIENDKIGQLLVRAFFSCTICFFVVKDKNWARWVLGFVCMLSGFKAIPLCIKMFGQDINNSLLILLIGSFYLFFATYLMLTMEKKA